MVVGGGAALLAVLVGGTAMGADLASRAMVTLLAWEPRRLRFLATRYTAVALASLAIGVLLQAITLGLGALTVQPARHLGRRTTRLAAAALARACARCCSWCWPGSPRRG
nr:hypothetical protein [Angustibacter aerolatus]